MAVCVCSEMHVDDMGMESVAGHAWSPGRGEICKIALVGVTAALFGCCRGASCCDCSLASCSYLRPEMESMSDMGTISCCGWVQERLHSLVELQLGALEWTGRNKS